MNDQNIHIGNIASAEAIYATLRIWKDANGNGTTDAGELQTLSAAGVQSINIAYTTRTATDVWFMVDRTYSTPLDAVRVKANTAKRTCATKSIAARAYSTCARARKRIYLNCAHAKSEAHYAARTSAQRTA